MSIAKAQGAFRLAFGSGDYRRDTGTSADTLAMAYPRSKLVVASRVGNLPGPIDGPTVGSSHPILREQSQVAVSLGLDRQALPRHRAAARHQRGHLPDADRRRLAQDIPRRLRGPRQGHPRRLRPARLGRARRRSSGSLRRSASRHGRTAPMTWSNVPGGPPQSTPPGSAPGDPQRAAWERGGTTLFPAAKLADRSRPCSCWVRCRDDDRHRGRRHHRRDLRHGQLRRVGRLLAGAYVGAPRSPSAGRS